MSSFRKLYSSKELNGKFRTAFSHACQEPRPCGLRMLTCSRRQSENVFVWVTEWETELFFDLQEVVRFRVEGEHWNDVAPQQPKPDEEIDETQKTPPYQIIVSPCRYEPGPSN